MEIWKDVIGFEGIYQVSNLGKVRRCFKNGTEHTLKGKLDKDGYIELLLSVNQCKTYHRLHRLVAEAFIPNPDNKPMVNHKDKNVRNNNVDNLEWVTAAENVIHGFATGRNVHRRTIAQYTKNMEFVRCWDSIKAACENLGLSMPNVIACCHGRQKTSGGYVWRYMELAKDVSV